MSKYEKYKGISLNENKTFRLPKELIIQLRDEAEAEQRKFYSYVVWKLWQKVSK